MSNNPTNANAIHRLVVGGTLCGKTSICRKLCEESHKRGVIATIHDPFASEHEWPDGAIVLDNGDDFFKVVRERIRAGQRQLCIIDEADTELGVDNKQNLWIATKGRHYGIENIFSTQRPFLIAPTARNMCAELFCFRVSQNDASALAGDFADARIREAAPNLNQGEFLYSRWIDGKKVLDKYSAFL